MLPMRSRGEIALHAAAVPALVSAAYVGAGLDRGPLWLTAWAAVALTAGWLQEVLLQASLRRPGAEADVAHRLYPWAWASAMVLLFGWFAIFVALMNGCVRA